MYNFFPEQSEAEVQLQGPSVNVLRQKNKKTITLIPVQTIRSKKSSMAKANGFTLLKAKNTVDTLNKKLSRYKHGFEIPNSIAKKIKQRRVSQWNEKSDSIIDENDERSINTDEITEELHKLKRNPRKRIGRINKQKKKRSKHPLPIPVPVETVIEPQTDTNHTFWNVKANSFSTFLFEYFEVKSRSKDMSRLFVKCVLCPDDKDLLSCVNGNNSNLKAHLESVIIFSAVFCSFLR